MTYNHLELYTLPTQVTSGKSTSTIGRLSMSSREKDLSFSSVDLDLHLDDSFEDGNYSPGSELSFIFEEMPESVGDDVVKANTIRPSAPRSPKGQLKGIQKCISNFLGPLSSAVDEDIEPIYNNNSDNSIKINSVSDDKEKSSYNYDSMEHDIKEIIDNTKHILAKLDNQENQTPGC